ncbi:MAG TPA: hypothetical protein VHW09_08155 [Bryobacteraceae bacterium]|nr:hypothetical protein [Bryobacteraceae bacterium]
MAPLLRARASENLIVTFDGDNLHLSSLGVHFLQGNSLSRLKEGSTVEYIATIGLFRDPYVSQFKRIEHHFFVSYDVWGTGDVFAVSTPGPPPRRATNLSLSGTETWCLERVAVATSGIAHDQQFWLQLELRTVPPKLSSIVSGGGIHLDVIEVLTPGQEERQTFRTGPMRLEDMPRVRGRRG